MGNTNKATLNSMPEDGSLSLCPGLPNEGKNIQAVKPGDHVCLLFETPLEWITTVKSFVIEGLEQNQKCMYVADSRERKQILDYIDLDGHDIKNYMASNQFVVLDQGDFYTQQGCFDPERVISMIAGETKKALKQGYSALRTTGEMSWVLGNVEGVENLCRYESKLNQLLQKHPCIALCQYDLNLFDAGLIQEILKTHPKVIHKKKIHHNYFYMPPDEYLDDARSACETRHWLENLEVMTEKQLQVRASEEIYRTLFETTGMPLCMVDDKGVILLVNNYFERVLGYSKKEIEGRMHFTRVVHPEEVDRLQGYFNLRVVSPGDVPDEYETRVIDKTGNIREAIFNVRMIPGSGNRVVSALDITELKDNEREIKRAHTRYKTLFENAPVAICERDFSKVKKIFDSLRKEGISDFKRYFEDHPEMVNKCIASSRLIEFNRAMAEIHGTSQGDLINSFVKDSTLNKKEFWHLFFDVFTRLAEGETRFVREYKIRTAKGRQKTVAMVMAVAQEFENDMSEVYFCFHDITALKESEARYRALVDLSGEIGESIIMLTDFNDQEAVITFTSTQFARLTGYKKHELLGKPFIDLIFPEDKEAALSRHRRKIKGESMPGLFEVRLLGKKGKIVPAELTSAVTDYQGKSVNVVYLRDVTERKKREQTLIVSEQRFKALSNKIIQHQEAERVKLSRELHDQFGQTLVSLRLELLNLQKQYHELSGCSRINQMLGCVDSLVEMTRTLASELRPGMLEKLGLVSTLQWYAEQFEQQTGISCKVFIKAPSLQDIEIQPDTAIVAYRIIQEALANVCKHSQATRVNIVLNVKNRNLVVAVEDNGIGAKLNKQEGQMHLGIMGMQERASIVGGEIKITTRLKKGFKLNVYLPLEKQIRGV